MKHLREVKATPNSIINDNSTYNTGTFQSHFKNLNLRDHPRKNFQKFLNNRLLTEWQAVEVLGDDIFIIIAIYKFNLINKSLFLVYDTKKDELFDFSSNSSFKHKSYVSKSLENRSSSMRATKDSFIEITNELENKKLYIKGHASKNNYKVEFDISFKVMSEPSVFVFPMTNKNVIYTEKDFLEPQGYITLNNIRYEIKDNNLAILDDHRGYYPMTSGYDWLACMGYINIKHQSMKFSLNLTDFYKNTDNNQYSENGYFINNEFIHLKNVSFTKNGNIWSIRDDKGSIDLTFIDKQHSTHIKKHIIKIDYLLAVGTVSGTLTLCDGTKIYLEDMFAMGEKRITQVLNTPIR